MANWPVISSMKVTTLVLPIAGQKVLLGLKKRGFGEGRWNGFGGKVRVDESITGAAMRELHEESGLETDTLAEVATLRFEFDTGLKIITHVFVTEEFAGTEQETEEMKPQWYHFDSIPYDEMWSDDRFWLPDVLAGKKLDALFYFDNPTNQIIKHYEITHRG